MPSIKVGKVNVKLVNRDRIVAKLKSDGGWEPETLSAWASIVRKDTTVVDVGSYSGIFAISALLLGAKTAIAVEPMPNLVQHIQENALLNEVDPIIISGAATDYCGFVTLHYSGVRFTAGASIEKLTSGRPANDLRVRALRLSDLPIKADVVSAVKIDVERHELPVLRGALELFRLHRPSIIVEVLTDEARKAVIDMLPDYEPAKELMDTRNLLLRPKPVAITATLDEEAIA